MDLTGGCVSDWVCVCLCECLFAHILSYVCFCQCMYLCVRMTVWLDELVCVSVNLYSFTYFFMCVFKIFAYLCISLILRSLFVCQKLKEKLLEPTAIKLHKTLVIISMCKNVCCSLDYTWLIDTWLICSSKPGKFILILLGEVSMHGSHMSRFLALYDPDVDGCKSIYSNV